MEAEKADPRRRAELAKIHMAKKALGLSEADYRAAVARMSHGRTETAAELKRAERGALLDHFKASGFRPKRSGRRVGPDRQQVLKARALWRSLWNLGATAEASDRALDAFVRRQTGVEALGWCTPGQLNTVIESLKGWCERLGFAPEVTDGDAHDAKVALVRAIWKRIAAADPRRDGSDKALDGWVFFEFCRREGRPPVGRVDELDDEGLDAAAEALGHWLRKVKGVS